ncbi:SDR family NAD(P)-dependent oxidoreductase [Actinophytocola algeriensis]|uniref:NAD(P)-dependent dehydrogenase (Short-subunit alcohol dehydrogenase family) n=1 Tax=Actinophytocola algeriensis TaxID=1768010 RepID=A0A7W7Q4H8_9PSEU|nr:SDR family NAD(P)-dependent oxidoreductase [Actinophytocola algeriensis]MBB4906742.1 NAD(P)-dependent dehydrogenase (short-subunit alcohol dehydrogenase family) [Actinophytocola algeriensis]MBE1478223.1 NAD(P)-dependent dehydrogenase (short-subunit alcohol dehydrogenase family) [Actinophytocola algeriensis]
MTILITGATDGLGRALAERFAADGHSLILHGRDAGKVARTADSLPGNDVRTVVADLAELEQVRRLAAEVRDSTGRPDVLVSNAGIGSGEPDGRHRRTSADGHELRFAVNYLAGFLLTLELLPLLHRVVNVASLGQHPIDFADLMIERGYSGIRAYGQSKLAQIMSGFELAARVPRVAVNSLHPGTYMPTKIVLQEIGHTVDTLESGVDAVHRLAVGEPGAVTGRFFDRTRETTANAQAYDENARRELWRRSLELVGHPGID